VSEQVINLGYAPRRWQHEAHAGVTSHRWSVLVLHRRAGKTVFAVILLIICALLKKNALFGYVAPFLNQARAIAWDILRFYASRVPGAQFYESTLSVIFPNGSTIRLFGGDHPHSLRGLGFSGLVLDEVEDLRPRLFEEVLRPALADNFGWCVWMGTPRMSGNLQRLYEKARGTPGWFHLRKTVWETEALTTEEVEDLRREMPPELFEQEMECVFGIAVSNQLISARVVEAAIAREYGMNDYVYEPRILACDPARFGDDSTVILGRQGVASFHPVELQRANTMEVADAVASMAATFDPSFIFVDETGLGAGVVDRLQQMGLDAIGVNFGSRATVPQYANKRTEMWCDMEEWLRTSGRIVDHHRLRNDLTGPLYKFDKGNRKLLESKDEMKARGLPSPDFGDALALTFANVMLAPSAPTMFRPRMSQSEAGHVLTEYEPRY
jgi:hypothetical protein